MGWTAVKLGFNFGQEKFFLFSKCLDRLWGPLSFLLEDIEVLSWE
jgi:hypothetical protein